MSMIYLRQGLERAILRNADPDTEVSTAVNEIIEEELLARGWVEPEDENEEDD